MQEYKQALVFGKTNKTVGETTGSLERQATYNLIKFNQ